MRSSITRAGLNRALLARQFLLERSTLKPSITLDRVGGLQAQEACPPHIGLWTRLEHYKTANFHQLLRDRAVVRATLMRCTLHLFTRTSYLRHRAVIQPALDKAMKSFLGRKLEGVDLPELVEIAREFFARQPATFESLRNHFETIRLPHDPRILAYAVRTQLPLVQVPSDDRWSFSAKACFTLAEDWLGAEVPTRGGNLEELVKFYLAAFGPATPADFRTWSGLKGGLENFASLRNQLVELAGPGGRTYFDLPEAPRPDDDTPCPVRFLPEYDHLVLGHDDRSRLMDDEHRARLVTKNLRVLATFLVDGRVAGLWSVTTARQRMTLQICPFRRLKPPHKKMVKSEAEKLLGFLASVEDIEPGATDLKFVADE